jgi:peptidoglycan/xylan/chitin deacetylase (PgdA/CDA1 family)
LGKGGAPYWRPPYGAYDSRVTSAASSVGFTKTIMWDIDTIDWRTISDGGPTAASMTAKVVANARTGSIVLMHLGGWHTYDALPSMVLRLRAVSLEPTTISALLRAS